MHVNTRYINSTRGTSSVHPLLVEFTSLVFTRMPGESYCRQLRSLWLYLGNAFGVLINSLLILLEESWPFWTKHVLRRLAPLRYEGQEKEQGKQQRTFALSKLVKEFGRKPQKHEEFHEALSAKN